MACRVLWQIREFILPVVGSRDGLRRRLLTIGEQGYGYFAWTNSVLIVLVHPNLSTPNRRCFRFMRVRNVEAINLGLVTFRHVQFLYGVSDFLPGRKLWQASEFILPVVRRRDGLCRRLLTVGEQRYRHFGRTYAILVVLILPGLGTLHASGSRFVRVRHVKTVNASLVPIWNVQFLHSVVNLLPRRVLWQVREFVLPIIPRRDGLRRRLLTVGKQRYRHFSWTYAVLVILVRPSLRAPNRRRRRFVRVRNRVGRVVHATGVPIRHVQLAHRVGDRRPVHVHLIEPIKRKVGVRGRQRLRLDWRTPAVGKDTNLNAARPQTILVIVVSPHFVPIHRDFAFRPVTGGTATNADLCLAGVRTAGGVKVDVATRSRELPAHGEAVVHHCSCPGRQVRRIRNVRGVQQVEGLRDVLIERHGQVAAAVSHRVVTRRHVLTRCRVRYVESVRRQRLVRRTDCIHYLHVFQMLVVRVNRDLPLNLGIPLRLVVVGFINQPADFPGIILVARHVRTSILLAASPKFKRPGFAVLVLLVVGAKGDAAGRRAFVRIKIPDHLLIVRINHGVRLNLAKLNPVR